MYIVKTTKLKKVFVLVVFIFLAFKHPFYLGVVDLKFDAKEKKLQGSVKLFTSDLEAALKQIHHKTIDLINTKNKEETNKILFDYLQKHLNLKINGKAGNYKLIGFEREEEAIWMYVEFEKSEIPKKIEVENTLLYDHLKDQMNITHIEVNNSKKSLKANNPEKFLQFDF